MNSLLVSSADRLLRSHPLHPKKPLHPIPPRYSSTLSNPPLPLTPSGQHQLYLQIEGLRAVLLENMFAMSSRVREKMLEPIPLSQLSWTGFMKRSATSGIVILAGFYVIVGDMFGHITETYPTMFRRLAEIVGFSKETAEPEVTAAEGAVQAISNIDKNVEMLKLYFAATTPVLPPPTTTPAAVTAPTPALPPPPTTPAVATAPTPALPPPPTPTTPAAATASLLPK